MELKIIQNPLNIPVMDEKKLKRLISISQQQEISANLQIGLAFAVDKAPFSCSKKKMERINITISNALEKNRKFLKPIRDLNGFLEESTAHNLEAIDSKTKINPSDTGLFSIFYDFNIIEMDTTNLLLKLQYAGRNIMLSKSFPFGSLECNIIWEYYTENASEYF